MITGNEFGLKKEVFQEPDLASKRKKSRSQNWLHEGRIPRAGFDFKKEEIPEPNLDSRKKKSRSRIGFKKERLLEPDLASRR